MNLPLELLPLKKTNNWREQKRPVYLIPKTLEVTDMERDIVLKLNSLFI